MTQGWWVWMAAGLAVAIALGSAGVEHARAQSQTAAPDGARLYATYCASCHGISGQGDGPVAPLLRRTPSNLTVLAENNGGVFPAARVHRIIDGRDVESHGIPEMPVWGDAFKRTSDGSEQAVQARIAALVKHLESMQRRTAQ